MKGKKFSKLNLLYVFSLVLGITIVILGFSVTNTAKNELEKQSEIAENAVEKTVEKKESTVVSKPAEKIKKTKEPNEVVATAKEEKRAKENFAPTLEDSVLVKPVEGEIVMPFSGNTFVYSQTYDEWGIHKGVHFSAKEKNGVKVVANGKVKRVYKDDREGLVVEIEHGDFVTVYANLSDDSKLKIGDELRAGDIVGKIAEGKDFLHFEVIYKGENIDPKPLFI